MERTDDAAARLLARRMIWKAAARGVGFVALAFSLAVGVLLAADWQHAGQAQTVRADTLAQALATARQAPGNSGAVAFARDLDRLARHAYFSSVTFRRHGIGLLALGLVLAVGCLHLAARLGRRIDDPRRVHAADPLHADRAARTAMLAAGGAALLLAVVWRATDMAALPPPVSAPAPRAPAPASVVRHPDAHPEPQAAVQADSGQAWSCFRGPWCGVAPWTNAPVAWDGRNGAGVAWKRELTAPGMNSPVVWGGQVFLTTGNEHERAVLAFDACTGAERWRRVVADGGSGDELPATSSDTGLAASTAACDTSGVYAVFGTGDLAVFTPDGHLRWQVFLRRPANPYGHASSLRVDGGRVYVQYDQSDEGRLLALDAANGRTLWEVQRTRGPAWSSPILAVGVDSRPLLVVNGHDQVSAFNPVDGHVVWETAGVSGEMAPSLACWRDRLYLANASARLVCYKMTSPPQQQWEYNDLLPDVASPVAAEGLLFLATSDGQLACLDATDGHEQWRHAYDIGFYASPIVCGDRLYALDRDGVMRIVAVQRAFREIASCPLGEPADATPAFGAGCCLYIRTRAHLWCVGQPVAVK